MKILPEFPRDAALGRCLAMKGEHSGRCVDLGMLAEDLPRKPHRLVVSELAIRGAAGHFGMVDEQVHAAVADENADLRAKLEHATTVIAGLLGALQALGVPTPTFDEPVPADEPAPAPQPLEDVKQDDAPITDTEVEPEQADETPKPKARKKVK